MNATEIPPACRQALSGGANAARPLLIADWREALFLHYEVDARELQPFVPFALDLWRGQAFISLVAFTMRRMRFAEGGRLGAWLCAPVATHEFLNLRTYVKHRGEAGICFLTEWLPNRLSLIFGPLLYALPYRHAVIDYRRKRLRLKGSVRARKGSFCYEGNVCTSSFAACAPESLDEFLLERYAAFNAGHLDSRLRSARLFRVQHEPWLQAPARVRVNDDTLLRHARWWRHARFARANFSPGVDNVGMSAPRKVMPEPAGHRRMEAPMCGP